MDYTIILWFLILVWLLIYEITFLHYLKQIIVEREAIRDTASIEITKIEYSKEENKNEYH